MAEPVGITGTAVGILSLCLQVYGGLKDYLDDYRDRDEYVNKTLLHLDRLRSLTNVIKSAIPTLQNGHSIPSQTVVLCLQDCEKEMGYLDKEIQKFKGVVATDLRGKLTEAKKKIKFPFDRSALEKLASSLDRVNGLLTVALEGLHLHAQSTSQSKLIDITNSTRATAAGIATIDTKIDEIHTRGATLEAIAGSSQTAITDISRDIRGLSLATTEIHSSMSQINQIQVETSSSMNILHDLSADYKSQQLRAGRLEDRMMEWKDAIINANENSPERRFLHMVMSRPDVLKNWQDDFAADKRALSAVLSGTTLESAISRTRHSVNAMSGTCGCQYRRYVNRKTSKWLVFKHFDESIVDLPHEPGCIRYKSICARHEHTSSILYTGLLQRLLNIAVLASFTRSDGAGGAGISATIRHFAMVDYRRSPAFQTVGILLHYVWMIQVNKPEGAAGYGSEERVEVAYQQIIRVAIRKLQCIFAGRSSLPTDIDEKGKTLIEAFISSYAALDSTYSLVSPVMSSLVMPSLVMRPILLSLLELGIPSLSKLQTEQHGMASWLGNRNLSRANIQGVVDKIAQLVFQGGSERCHLSDCSIFLTPASRNCFAEVDGIRESFGLDSPLFTSLLRKDELMLKRALQLPPTSSDSLISNGVSAVHIAVFWPKGLELLLYHRQDADLDMRSGSPGITPLEMAFSASNELCHKRTTLYHERGVSCRICREHGALYQERGVLCHNCHCADSVKILLERGCRIPQQRVTPYFFRGATPNAIKVFLYHIRSWRERLMEMARRELCDAEIYDMGVDDSSILDHAAPRVIQKLEAKGVYPSIELKLDPYDYRLSPESDGSETSSLYHDLINISWINIAFSLGFKDIDVFYHNRTPIMARRCDPKMYEWHLDRGAIVTNLVFPDTNKTLPFAADRLLWTVAHNIMLELGSDYFESKDVADRLILRLGSSDMGDDCECGCSDLENGCSPLKVFLSAAIKSSKYNPLKDLPATPWTETIDNLLSIFPATANTLIRICTFEALGIRHTCCTTYHTDWLCPMRDGDDVSYIREEDELLLKELEELVAEFEGIFHSQEQPLLQFMAGHWKHRIEQVWQEKVTRCLSKDEIDAAADLGIRLCEESSDADETQIITLGGYVEDYICKLNEIYPD